jgi:hypothetical protein
VAADRVNKSACLPYSFQEKPAVAFRYSDICRALKKGPVSGLFLNIQTTKSGMQQPQGNFDKP